MLGNSSHKNSINVVKKSQIFKMVVMREEGLDVAAVVLLRFTSANGVGGWRGWVETFTKESFLKFKHIPKWNELS